MDPATTAAFNTPPRFSLRLLNDKEARESVLGYMSPGATAQDVRVAQDKASKDLETLTNKLLEAPIPPRPVMRPRLTDTATTMV